MGTKIQSKTYNPGYYSMRDLNNNAGNGMWALYDEGKTLKNGKFYDSFLTSSAVDTYIGHEKEKMRQTILKHESVFRNQLQELHRLYRRQRDLMNELERREFCKHSLPAETSKSSLFLSQTPCEDASNTRNVSNFPLVGSSFGRSPASDAGIIQPPLSFIKGKSTYSPFSSHDRVHSKDPESLKPRCNNFQRKRFDLELPAEFCTNNEGKQQGERFCAVAGMESYLHERNRDVNLSPGSGLDNDCNGDSLRSKLYLKSTHNLADLNKPIWVEETSITDSVNNVDGSTCLGEDIQKRDIFVNSISGSQFWSKERGLGGKDGRIVLNGRHSESNRSGNAPLTRNSIAGQTKYDDRASLGGISDNHTSTLFRSLQVEPGKVHEAIKFSLSDHSNLAPERERTIFGVEISDRNHNRSVDTSHTPSLHPLNQQSDGMKSMPSCIVPCRNMSSTLGQKLVSFQGNPCLSTLAPITERPPNSRIQLPGIFVDEMHSSDNLRSPSSRSEASHQDALCYYGSRSGVKQLHACLDLNSYPHLQQHSASADLEMPHCCGKQIKVKEIIYQMNLDSLQNHSQHFFYKATMAKGPFIDLASPACVVESGSKKVDDGDSQGSRKILGFPVVKVPYISKDLTSPRSASKPTHRASNLDTDGTLIDSANNSESVSQLKVRDSVAENGLNCFSGLRLEIDLNLSVNEEEASSTPCLPKAIVKVATMEIDLEAPGVLESNSVVSAEADHFEKLNEIGPKESLDDSRERNEEIVRVAAEAIIHISLSQMDVVDTSCQLLEASRTDCLLWLADVISSYEVTAHENKVIKGLISRDDACDGKIIPKGMDYFEFMTLKLEDSKEQEYFYKPYNLENLNDEENIVTSVAKQPRKGQTRRVRQRKDFQRDVLPGLVSLSRYEVLEDLQTIEDMFKACGYNWRSSLSQRGAAKNGRGRRRSVGLAPPQTVSAVCPPPVQQPTYRELELEDKNLTGWGKRTRRLPRQRCSTGTRTPVLECRFAV